MPSTRSFVLLALCALASLASAQSFSTGYSGTFVDISTTGGTPISGAGDDSEHNITTTVGNAMFPAGSVRIGNNGALAAGVTSGEIGFINATVAPTGIPSGLPAGGSAYLLPLWDDYVPPTATANTTIWWQEGGGVLYIMWLNEDHYDSNTVGGTTNLGLTITLEVQVFANPGPGAPWIQFFYPDPVFGGVSAPYDNAASATIGYVKGSLLGVANALYSFDTPAVTASTIITIVPPMQLSFSSPFGPGSIQADIDGGPLGGTYFLCVTLNAGNFPNGYFFGIAPSFPDVVNQATSGWPFVFALDGTGHYTIGPFPGLPTGFTLYSVALGFDTPLLDYPTLRTGPKVYVIP